MRFPNTAFGLVLGVAGSSIMWRTIGAVPFTRKVLGTVGNWVVWLAGAAALGIILSVYLTKVVLYPRAVLKEWRHETRSYFFAGPHLGVLMLVLGSPPEISTLAWRRTGFCIGYFMQMGLTWIYYSRWMFSETASLDHARPQYLLSTVGWFLLSLVAQGARIDDDVGLRVPAMMFGCGAFSYTLALFAIFRDMHRHVDDKAARRPTLALILILVSYSKLHPYQCPIPNTPTPTLTTHPSPRASHLAP